MSSIAVGDKEMRAWYQVEEEDQVVRVVIPKAPKVPSVPSYPDVDMHATYLWYEGGD